MGCPLRKYPQLSCHYLLGLQVLGSLTFINSPLIDESRTVDLLFWSQARPVHWRPACHRSRQPWFWQSYPSYHQVLSWLCPICCGQAEELLLRCCCCYGFPKSEVWLAATISWFCHHLFCFARSLQLRFNSVFYVSLHLHWFATASWSLTFVAMLTQLGQWWSREFRQRLDLVYDLQLSWHCHLEEVRSNRSDHQWFWTCAPQW